MTLTLILNIVFAVAVVGGIVALLGGAILTDRPRAQARAIRPAPR